VVRELHGGTPQGPIAHSGAAVETETGCSNSGKELSSVHHPVTGRMVDLTCQNGPWWAMLITPKSSILGGAAEVTEDFGAFGVISTHFLDV